MKDIQEHEQTIQDLNDQVRDLTFFLEARDKVQGHPELEGGSVGTHTRQPRKRRGKR
jgi:BRCA1-associated protein